MSYIKKYCAKVEQELIKMSEKGLSEVRQDIKSVEVDKSNPENTEEDNQLLDLEMDYYVNELLLKQNDHHTLETMGFADKLEKAFGDINQDDLELLCRLVLSGVTKQMDDAAGKVIAELVDSQKENHTILEKSKGKVH